MHIVATFEYSTEVELAISGLEQKGIKNQQMQAIVLNQRAQEKKIFDTINHADGLGTIDAALGWGTVFMLLGTIYGYIWPGGPIIWGLVGLIAGVVLGFGIDFHWGKARRKNGRRTSPIPEVCLIINCDETQKQTVEDLLWDHFPLSVGRVESS